MRIISQSGIAPQGSYYSCDYATVRIEVDVEEKHYIIILNSISGEHRWDRLVYARYKTFEAAGKALKGMINAEDAGQGDYRFPADNPTSLSYSESHGVKEFNRKTLASEYLKIEQSLEYIDQKAGDIDDDKLAIRVFDTLQYVRKRQRELED